MHKGDEGDIRRKAYEIWESEGRPKGRHAEHWRRAHETFKNVTTTTATPSEDMHAQDKAMIPQNSAEHLTQTEPKLEPAPPANRARTQRRKTPSG